MKIGAYQFEITSDINSNMQIIEKAIQQAAKSGIKLLTFPECSLTGYPPHDIQNSSSVNFDELNQAYEKLQTLAIKHSINIIIGTIFKEDGKYYNSAIVFSPNKDRAIYHKRALWGWDRENFSIGNKNGIFFIEGMKIGIRICFEVRFPEFFRELYKEKTDLNIVLFYDFSKNENIERYEMIKSHIKTRAVENVTHTLSVNTCKSFQSAPTALYDRSGNTMIELRPNEENLLSFDLKIDPIDFGEKGRKKISDWLVGIDAP